MNVTFRVRTWIPNGFFFHKFDWYPHIRLSRIFVKDSVATQLPYVIDIKGCKGFDIPGEKSTIEIYMIPK